MSDKSEEFIGDKGIEDEIKSRKKLKLI